MRIVRWLIVFCVLILLSGSGMAWGDDVDISGKWQSSYDFDVVEEIMTANVQQIGENLLGSFSVVREPSGEEYSGIAFGTIDDDEIKAYYLCVRNRDGSDPLVTITFTDAVLKNDDIIQGKFYYHDSDLLKLSGSYEATRC